MAKADDIAVARAKATAKLGVHSKAFSLYEHKGTLYLWSEAAPEGVPISFVVRTALDFLQTHTKFTAARDLLKQLGNRTVGATDALVKVLNERNAARYEAERWRLAWKELYNWDPSITYQMNDLCRKHELPNPITG